MSVKFTTGSKKKVYGSLRAAYEAAKVNEPNLKYITFYMRVRHLDWKPATAMSKPVRKYERRELVAA